MASQLPPEPIEPYVCGTDGQYSVVVVSDAGMTWVQPATDGYIIFLLLSLVPFLVGTVSKEVSGFVLATLYLVLGFPVFEELTFRRVKRLLALPPAAVIGQKAAHTVAWSQVYRAVMRGDSVLATSSRSGRVVVEPDVLGRTRETLALKLGDRFSIEGRSGSLRLRFPLSVVIIFVLSTCLLVLAAVLPFFPGEESRYAAILASTNATFAGASAPKTFALIFLNNIQVALAAGFPLLGLLGLGASFYNTGRVVQVIALQRNVSPSLLIGVLYLAPHTWVETMSYAVAASVFLRMFAHQPSHPGLSRLVADRRSRASTWVVFRFAIVTGMLLSAAFLETVEPYLGVYQYLLWIPVLTFTFWYLRRYVLGPSGHRLTDPAEQQ